MTCTAALRTPGPLLQRDKGTVKQTQVQLRGVGPRPASLGENSRTSREDRAAAPSRKLLEKVQTVKSECSLGKLPSLPRLQGLSPPPPFSSMAVASHLGSGEA